MKKFILLFIAIGLIGFSCTDELQTELDDLKAKVDSLESANAVVGVEFEGNDLVVTFGDGTTSTVTTPEGVIPTFVSDFVVNTEANTITVVFSDGTSAEYVVYTNGGTSYLSATLSGDYGIATMKLGDVELAEFAYDDQFRLISAMLNLPDGSGNVINVGEFQNNYSAAEPTIMVMEKSLYSDIDYYTVENYSYDYSYFPGDSGYNFVQEDGDMYSLYVDRYYTGSEYRYRKYNNCWFISQDDIDWDVYNRYYRVADEDSLFYLSYNNYYSMTIDEEYGYVFYPNYMIEVTEVYEAGETRDTLKSVLTMRDDNLIDKMEFLNRDGEVNEYFDLVYDASAMLTNIDIYFYEEEVTDPSKKSISEDAPELVAYHVATITPEYSGSFMTGLSVSQMDEDGNVDETLEMGELVYDEVGNPVEIWAADFSYGSGPDYDFGVDANGKILMNPKSKELTKLVEIEYDYMLPNFFGKTLEYFVPELKGMTVKNAPVRIVQSGFFNFANMEYSDFNEGGYPAKVKLDLNIMDYYGVRKSAELKAGPSLPMGGEILVEYTKFE